MSQAGYTPIQLYYSTTAAATPSSGNLANGELAINITDGKLFYKDNGGTVQVLATKAGASGDVVGPGSSTDNALVRFDGTTGKLVQNSAGVLDDSGNMTGIAALTMSGALTLSGGTANGVAYLNGSKVLTTGSALTFDGTEFKVNAASGNVLVQPSNVANAKLYMRHGSIGNNNGFEVDVSSNTIFLQAGSEQMRLTSTGLGIGTSSPGAKLNVSGTVSGNSVLLNGSGVGANYARITSTGGDALFGVESSTGSALVTGGTAYATVLSTIGATPLQLGTNSAVRVTLDSSGNLGLGVTPSGWTTTFGLKALQVYGSALASNGTSGYLTNNAYYATGSYTPTYIAASSTPAQAITFNRTGANDIQFLVAPSGTAGNAISFTQAMTLDASGNLGVGTTSPTKRISAVNTGTGGPIIEITGQQGVGNELGFGVDGTGGYLQQNGSKPISFYTGGSERARIDSSGNLLVGTTAVSTSNLNGTAIRTYSGGSYIEIAHNTSATSGQDFAAFRYNGTQIGGITQNGTTGVLYNLTSDYRLKNNPVALTGSGAFIDALQPKTWDWWDGSGKGVGFIAHEFMEVAKYSGNGEKDAVDADGNPVYQSIQPSSSEVMAYLVAEIQSLRKRLAAAGIA